MESDMNYFSMLHYKGTVCQCTTNVFGLLSNTEHAYFINMSLYLKIVRVIVANMTYKPCVVH